MLQLWSDARSAVRVVRLTDDVEIDVLVNVFENVAAEKGWQPEGALSLYRDRSVYFGLEVLGKLAGGIQLVSPSATGSLSCQAVWPELRVGASNRCAHVAILALDRAYRGPGFFWLICVEMWRYCVGRGIEKLFIECSPRILALYRRVGWPLKIEGELRRHWGGDTFLCTLGIPEVAHAILLRGERSAYYKEIVAQMFRLGVAEECRISGVDVAGTTQVVCAC